MFQTLSDYPVGEDMGHRYIGYLRRELDAPLLVGLQHQSRGIRRRD